MGEYWLLPEILLVGAILTVIGIAAVVFFVVIVSKGQVKWFRATKDESARLKRLLIIGVIIVGLALAIWWNAQP